MATKSKGNPHARSRYDALVLIGQEKPPTRFTVDKQKKYLIELAEHGLKQRAAACVGISDATVLLEKKRNPEFKALCVAAEEIFAEKLITEAKRRAYDGYEEAVYQKGSRVFEDCEDCTGLGILVPEGTYLPAVSFEGRAQLPVCNKCKGTGKGKPAVIRKYSERLMERLLAVYDNRFRDHVEASVNVTGGVLAVPMQHATVEDWANKWKGAETIDVTEEPKNVTPKATPEKGGSGR